jgi:sugar O-acyltransferase (sialic acid O-acetyltransferase NeuD family)
MLVSIGLDPDLVHLMLDNGCQNYLAPKPNSCFPEVFCLGDDEEIQNQIQSGAVFFFGLDNPKLRKELFSKFGFHGKSLVSDMAICVAGIDHSAGITIADFAYVGPGAEIQNFVKIGVRASIHHDCRVGKFSVIGPSVTICGRVSVGEAVFIGAGATILPGVQIGSGSVIGAGSVVTKDVQPETCVVGVPARSF